MATIRQINSTTKCIGEGLNILWGLSSVPSFPPLTLKGRKGRKEKGNFHNPYNSHTYLSRGRLVHFSPPANRNQIASRDFPPALTVTGMEQKSPTSHCLLSSYSIETLDLIRGELPWHRIRGLPKGGGDKKKVAVEGKLRKFCLPQPKRGRMDSIAVRPFVAMKISF